MHRRSKLPRGSLGWGKGGKVGEEEGCVKRVMGAGGGRVRSLRGVARNGFKTKARSAENQTFSLIALKKTKLIVIILSIYKKIIIINKILLLSGIPYAPEAPQSLAYNIPHVSFLHCLNGDMNFTTSLWD